MKLAKVPWTMKPSLKRPCMIGVEQGTRKMRESGLSTPHESVLIVP